MHRRTAPRVVGGRVLRKNNWKRHHGDYVAVPQAEIRIDRKGPPPGFRHLVTVAALRRFLDLLPGWDEIAVGLDAIVLDDRTDVMGWHRPHVIAVCPWERELWWTDVPPAFFDANLHMFERLEVDFDKVGDQYEVRFTEPQARAFQLLDVLPHELGHHHDRMTTRSRRRVARGERYAEAYARRVMDDVWDAYVAEFGL